MNVACRIPFCLTPLALLGLMMLATTAAAEEQADKKAQAGEVEPGDEAVEEPPMVGFELGQFYLKDFRAVEGVKTRLRFTVHASVKSEASEAFEKRLERRKMRVRSQVITAMRLADPAEYEDPHLKLIRRRLFLRLRRALPDLQIDEIYFSDFSYFVE